MQVKCFTQLCQWFPGSSSPSGSLDEIEDRINEFLRDNADVEIHDIRISSQASQVAAAPNTRGDVKATVFMVTAMVLYEEGE